jgi:DNA (cytosine-5)-methyltransferase 1
MKRDTFTLPLGLGNELIIDNFAGGGGTSTGLEQAFGRPVDIAINHDPEALAMHAANHPHTRHLCESVWDVDPIKVTSNQPVALVWLSPDCKHFSKAKGGKPVEKKIRGLAWVTLRWAAKCKPRVIMLENVEEFKTWGPLLIDADGTAKPDPAKKGRTFDSFVRQLKGHGYEVDWRELRACDLDTPTIRKRFFLVARRDGIPIQWPVATNAAPDSLAVKAGKLLPYRTAAECIDWSIPCPSIFERKKPLADATLRRIAKGIMRYVVNAANPFIVGQGGPVYSGKPVPTDRPFGTLTTENHRAVVVPSIVPIAHYNGRDTVQDAAAPLSTNTAHPSGGSHALVSAVLTGVGGRAGQSRPRGVDEPTATGTSTAEAALITAVLVDAAHGEVSPGGVKRWGQGHKDIEQPLGTVAASGNQALVSAFLAKHYTGVVGSDLQDPLGTVTSSDHHSMVTAHVTKFRAGAVGSGMDEPLHTVTAGGQQARPGTGNAMGLVTSNLVKLRGTSSAAATDEPLGTISAGGQHHAEVRAFLLSYYGSETETDSTNKPLRTVTSRERFGLVTIAGQDYEIVDIGLRMLAPRELFRAQGFGDDYIIDMVPDWEKLFVDGHQVADVSATDWRPLTKSAQVRMCGNSVCPPMARALITANFAHEREFASEAA